MNTSGGFKHLVPGRRYVVSRAFTDYDWRLHPQGERWTFLKAGFVPYHDGLTLEVQPAAGGVWQIRLQWQPGSQGDILDNLEHYLAADVS